MIKTLKFLLKIMFAIISILIIIVFLVYVKFRLELPNMEQLVEDYSPAVATKIYDRNDKIIDVLFAEDREIVRIDEIPENVKNAFLSIEDKQFYSHHGINLKRLLGAMLVNIKNKKTLQGASSITQQLAKNAFLTSEKKISRKIKEAIITIEMEKTYTKDEILEKYLNEIYFGSGSYGIKTAAKQFFKKDVKDLNIAEAALLAGIPNRPSKYDPVNNLDNALSRQKIILKEMINDKKITEEEYKNALEYKFEVENEKNIVSTPKNTTVIYKRKNKNVYKNPEFTGIIEDFLKEMYPEEKIYTSGLKIYTTLDLEFQNTAREVFENYPIFKNNSVNGAMLTVDPFTGSIISMVGGRNFKAKNFDRSIMAKRQYGSTFKPFLYLASMNNGFAPYSVVVDEFISRGKWAPKNSNGKYISNTTLFNSLNFSINIPAIKLLDSIGIDKFKEETQSLKYNGEIKDLTAALGSIDGTPLNLAVDFSIFVNGGKVVEPNFVREIKDAQNTLLYTNEIKSEEIYDSADTSLLTAMLKNVVSMGTGSRARVTKDGKAIEQAGKTGTTNQNRTIWYAGMTAEYVTVIYIGRDDNKPMYNVSGGSTVAPLWAKYYQSLINNKIYSPGKFKFLDNHLEVGDLLKQNIDIFSGLLDGKNSREMTVRSGKIQVENANKYKNGIASIFGMDSYVNTFDYINNVSNISNETGNIENLNKIDNKNEDHLFKRLLGE